MPAVPRGNTNAPTMVGEKAADLIRSLPMTADIDRNTGRPNRPARTFDSLNPVNGDVVGT